MLKAKTLEEHCEYVERFARVSLYFAQRWLARSLPEKKVSERIVQHTPLLFHALGYSKARWNNPRCLSILARADECASLSPEDFEEAMWQDMKEHALQRARFTFTRHKAPERNCGSLRYDPPRPDIPEGWCAFHIHNAVTPRSFFDDPGYLALCFLLLMRENRLKYNSHTLYTGTWLNDREDWLAFFPQEWINNLTPKIEKAIPQWHTGWWGQLITGRGTINPKAEDFLRKNGFLKFSLRTSHCSFNAMEMNLKTKYGKQLCTSLS